MFGVVQEDEWSLLPSLREPPGQMCNVTSNGAAAGVNSE